MKISVTSPSFSNNSILASEFLRLFPNGVLNKNAIRFNKYELMGYLSDSDAAIVGLETIDEEILLACPKIKIIAKYGVGLDNIDIEACRKRGVVIGWSGGINKLSVAEMTVGFMLMLSRKLYMASNQLKAGTWNKNGGFQLSGKTVGIIGFGYIGQEVARLLAAFECKILINDIVDKKEEAYESGVAVVEKNEIFEKADFITIHTPLTNDTRNLIDEKALASVKKTAFIINTARGGIVDEKALKIALENNSIAGAALDVYFEEPPRDMDFLALPNLICTPHIGGNAEEAVLAMGRSAIGHLQKFFKV